MPLDHLGSRFDTPGPAKEAHWEYFTTLGAGQRVLHLRGVLSEAVERSLGEDVYLEECEATPKWPKISLPEGTELEDPWWGANTGSLIGDDAGNFDWPATTDPSIPQDILEQLRTVPAYFHGVYSVLDSPYWITDQDDFPQGLVAFAKSNGRICVDPTTGAVVKTSQYIIDYTTPVNSSLAAFAQCAHTCAEHYPFYQGLGKVVLWCCD